MHVFTTAQVRVLAIPQLVAIAIIVGNSDRASKLNPLVFAKGQHTPDYYIRRKN